MEREKQYEWAQKSKKYRTRYLDELKKLYGQAQEESKGNGDAGYGEKIECETIGRP